LIGRANEAREGFRRGLAFAVLCLCAAATACTVSTGRGLSPPGDPTPAEDDDSTIVIGAYDFTESRVLAQIFAAALRDQGYRTKVVHGISSREIMKPAVEQGLVDLVAEYQGTMLNFVTGDDETAALPARAANERLASELAEGGITVLDFAEAQNRNEIVVTRATASEFRLERISDLRPVASEMVFGGPPECPVRPLCLPGLEQTYGLEFNGFQPLDVGGPLTVNALTGGEIDVGLLFSTDPAIGIRDLVVLIDDRDLQPPENVVPVVREETVDAYGDEFTDVVNSITSHMSTSDLQLLNAGVDVGGADPRDVAEDWLAEQGGTE
jgi:osmoprotectant transport system substrate-binding protein